MEGRSFRIRILGKRGAQKRNKEMGQSWRVHFISFFLGYRRGLKLTLFYSSEDRLLVHFFDSWSGLVSFAFAEVVNQVASLVGVQFT